MSEDTITLENRLLQNGCIVMYYSPFLMEQHSCELVLAGWTFKEIYAASKGSQNEFFDQVSMQLDFPDYFGRNLDALNDCLSDIVLPESRRLAFGLTRFDLLAQQSADFAHAVLDIFARMERSCLMRNERILLLIQSSNPNLNFPPVGGTPVLWNFKEWHNADRMKSPR